MIILDTETTGFTPGRDEILSLGAIRMDKTRKFTNEFYAEYRVEGDHRYDDIKGALNVNGFTMDQINDKSKKTFREGFNDFVEWCMDAEEVLDPKQVQICGQNIQFDAGFIKASVAWPFDRRMIDSYGVMWTYQQLESGTPKNLGLDAWIKYFKLEKRGAHNAMEDAKLTGWVINSILLAIEEKLDRLF